MHPLKVVAAVGLLFATLSCRHRPVIVRPDIDHNAEEPYWPGHMTYEDAVKHTART